jgi:hypothetical protein
MKTLSLVFTLLSALSIAHAEQIVFSEIMYHPPAGGHEFIEVENLTSTPFDIAEWRLSEGVSFEFPAFSEGAALDSFLKAFEKIILCDTDAATFREAYNVPAQIRIFGPWTGRLANGGERITLEDKNGTTRCSLRYDDRHPWPLAADGAGHSLLLIDDSFAIDDHRVWSSAPPTPGFTTPLRAEEPFQNPEVNLAVGLPFVRYSDQWSFNDQNVNLGMVWKDPGYAFSDAGWTMETDPGNNGGLYGFENSALPAPGLQTPMLNSDNAANHMTYYLRKEFTYNGPTTGATVTIDSITDDGVYFYLNGVPIGGVGANANAGWKEPATRTVGNASEELEVATNDGSALVNGVNVLAAQVHQTNASSSDCVFGARLSIATPLNPSLVINEVLPAPGGFIELYNPGAAPVDLTDWYLGDGPGSLTRYQIPSGLIVPPSGFAIINFEDAGFSPEASTTIYLTEEDGSTIANAIDAAIPLDGRSLGRKGDGSSSWFLFTEATPNAPNASASSDFSLKINEAAFNEDGLTEWIEIFNPSSATSTLDGLFLASQADFSDQVPLSGAVGPNGFLTVNQAFPVDDDELTLFLIGGGGQVLDAAALPYRPPRNHAAAFPDGSGEFYASASGSPAAANHPDRETAIVISELMVDPPSEHRDGEFIELYNKSNDPVDLSGWYFSEGVDFTFPPGTVLAGGGYLVVASNARYLNYPNLVGQYEGRLANRGERLRLVDSWDNEVDFVHYQTGGNWPDLARGQGSSLELKHPEMDNSQATAWTASDESAKSTFETFTITDQYLQNDSRGGVSDFKELHLQAVGDAHLALRNLSFTRNGSGNLLPGNGRTLATGGSANDGWLCQGTHHRSFVSNGEFHLVSTGHGDVKANRCEIDVVDMQDNNNLTFTFQARWISGKPTLNVQTWDRSFGGTVHLPVPRNLGSPGAPNPSALNSPVPTLSGLIHSPAVPTSSDPVRVTVEAGDAETVTLRHRLDTTAGNGSWNGTVMHDDGTNGGDEIANDGIYSATLTNYQSDNAIVQFYVEAASPGGTTLLPRPAPERPAMWVVDNSTHPSDLRIQRFVISARDRSASSGAGESATFDYDFPRLSNQYFNATLINNERDIIYNCEMRKSGSPWTRAGNDNFARMKWKPPGDRLFRGYTKRSVDNDAGGSRAYHNRIIRYWLYLFGHPANENEFIRVIINGGSASLREDVEPNANDFLRRNWEDGHKGELYRIDDEWWFEDNWSRRNRNATWEYKNTNEPERYSSEWIKRSREAEHDYSSFISWTRMVGTNSFTRAEIERTADIDLMAANAVVRGWCDDWDTLTRNRGKNGHFLRRVTDGRWMLIQWDSDLTFGNSGAPFLGNLAGVRNFYNKPYVRQRVNHYLHEMVTKYTANSPRLEAWLQCEEDASNSYSSNRATYNNWNSSRISTANSTIGSARNTNFNVTSGNGSSLNTSNEIISLQGSSGSDVFDIRVAGQPWATTQFTGTVSWTLSGIQLRQGANSIVVEAVDREGNVVGRETFTVNKTGNSSPVVVLDADPGSFNVPVNSDFFLDATQSYDPEGGLLTFAWELQGGNGFSNPTTTSARMRFTAPGHYPLTLTVTDPDGRTTQVTREINVHSRENRDRFNEGFLRDSWTLENLVLRDGSMPSSSYSFDETPNRLAVKVEMDQAKPLTLSSPRHPALWQELPEDDWSFSSEVTLTSVQQGDFHTGVIVEGRQNNSPVRFTVGLEDGDFLRVRKVTSSSVTILETRSWPDRDVVVRARKTGNTLLFQYQSEPGVWVELASEQGDFTTTRAGLFASTDSPQALRVEFDDAILVDPALRSPALEFLRITELMYHPAGEGEAEFIEIQNIGSEPLSLAGVSFDDTQPFAAFTFADLTLAPGQYAVLVSDESAFRRVYGNQITIAGQWDSGSLSNGGETIQLRDPLANLIHDFSYDDTSPWPEAADGRGSSLEVVDPNGDYNDPLNWRASTFAGGSPGQAQASDEDEDGLSDIREAVLGTDPNRADSDGDGASDGSETIAGTDPLNGADYLRIISLQPTSNSGELALTWTSLSGLSYVIETSANLSGPWTPTHSVVATGPVSQITDLISGEKRFYRVRVFGP